VAFVARACYLQTGGNTKALKKTIICTIFGAVCAWVAALLLLSAPGGPGMVGVIVGATVLVLCLAAHIPTLSTIPASVHGYASVITFLFGNPSTNLTKEAPLTASPTSALVAVPVSMVIGALLGLVSNTVAWPAAAG
jgi:hypothetical protein